MTEPFLPPEFPQSLPLILAGPILQRTTATATTVWLALKQPCQVELILLTTTEGGRELGQSIGCGTGATIAIGQHLHIVAVTARIADDQQPMTGDRLYAYDLRFCQHHQSDRPQTYSPQTYSLNQALCSDQTPTVNISYFPHQKPTFALPPSDIGNLRIVHGSCRKPHGDGLDALTLVDCLIETAAQQPKHRPHQLFLTGDQIYADDVAEPLLWVASQVGDALLGWEENLPIDRKQSHYCTPRQLPPGSRAEVATRQAGFTAGLNKRRSKVKSHLFSLGEYYASYLLAWSPICWQSVPHNRPLHYIWNLELDDMAHFIHTLWKVRRALANVPTHSIFDDHDVSDDWNLNRAWCLRVLGKPLGRRVVQNALLAYAVFQAWGNTPEQFEPAQSGEHLLRAAQAWSESAGTDFKAYDAIAQCVGMPELEPETGLPKFVESNGVYVLARSPAALTWNYVLRSACHEVIVLDTRTWRGYPTGKKAIAPPMLLCPEAFERQLRQPLQASQGKLTTFVIAPTNVFGLQVIDWIHHWQLRQNRVFAADVGDSWNLHAGALTQLLNLLLQQRQQVVILSGDIHYSSAARLSVESFSDRTQAPHSVLVQLTSSAMKNEEMSTRVIHTRLKEWLLPEKIRHWWGGYSPPRLARSPHTASDWHGRLEWLHRQPAQSTDFCVDWLLPRSETETKDRLRGLKFWRSRWFREGREVVGVNNLALVRFEGGVGSRGDLRRDGWQQCRIVQDVYWFANWQELQIVCSRYEGSLDEK